MSDNVRYILGDRQLDNALLACRRRAYFSSTLDFLATHTSYMTLIYSISITTLALSTGLSPRAMLTIAVIFAGLVFLCSAYRAIRIKYSILDTARTIDRVLSTGETLSAALEFVTTDSPFTPMLTQRAIETGSLIKPKEVVPIRWPRRAVWALTGIMVAGAISFLPYTSSWRDQGSEADTRMAVEGYRLIEESRKVTANAQAIGDKELQRVGEELGKTARKMTEKFTSERQVERSLQKISKSLDELSRYELTKSTGLSESSKALEDAYSRLMSAGRRSAEGKQQLDMLRRALNEAASHTSDEALSKSLSEAAKRPGDGPSDSDILDAMQRLQEESAGAQSRQNAMNQAMDALNQTMSSLGYERKSNSSDQGDGGTNQSDMGQKNQGQESKGSQENKGSNKSNIGNDGNQGDEGQSSTSTTGQGRSSDGSSEPTPSGDNGLAGTEGSHLSTYGNKDNRPQGSGEMKKLSGRLGQGSATSTTVITGATSEHAPSDAGSTQDDGYGNVQTNEEAVLPENIPASYRKIVSEYFRRGK